MQEIRETQYIGALPSDVIGLDDRNAPLVVRFVAVIAQCIYVENLTPLYNTLTVVILIFIRQILFSKQRGLIWKTSIQLIFFNRTLVNYC